MLDTFTLRVAFGLVATCVLVLFYFATYRVTRSAYSGWWCFSLACFVAGASLYLANGTPLQVVANPAGNVVGTIGAAGVWAAARSLSDRPVGLRHLVPVPLAVLVCSALGDPAHDVWAGGTCYLLGMAVLVGSSSWELRRVLSERSVEDDPGQAPVLFAVRAMGIASGVVAVFYGLRAVVLASVGQHNGLFVIGFGPQPTTLLTLLLLVVVTFSMATLGHAQQTSDLRVRATRDGLTGLLNREEFLRTAQRRIDRGRRGGPMAVLVADLDDFKALNDGRGHAAGDEALRHFAEVGEAVVGARGLVGRLGGDEFVLLAPAAEADQVAAAVAERYADADSGTTVSLGIAPVRARDHIEVAIARADAALYQAKAHGRARAVRWEELEPGSEEPVRRRTA